MMMSAKPARCEPFSSTGKGWIGVTYCLLADAWSVYDNSGRKPVLLEQGP